VYHSKLQTELSSYYSLHVLCVHISKICPGTQSNFWEKFTAQASFKMLQYFVD